MPSPEASDGTVGPLTPRCPRLLMHSYGALPVPAGALTLDKIKFDLYLILIAISESIRMHRTKRTFGRHLERIGQKRFTGSKEM